MSEVFHICFVGMNKSTVYFSLAFYPRREDVCGRVIAAPFTWTSVSACALSDRRDIALLCSYTFSALLLHRCALFVFPLSLYHSQRRTLPHVSACPFLWATGSTEYFSFVSKRIVASCLS